MSSAPRRSLPPDDRSARARWFGLAGALLVVSTAFFALVRASESEPLWAAHLTLWWEGYALALVAVAALAAYRGSGPLVAWTLCFAGVFGVLVNLGGVALVGDPPGLFVRVAMATVGGLFGGLLVGTGGYVAGAVLKRATATA